MTTFTKNTRGVQHNVLDGTVYAYEPVPGDGVYATIAGRDGQVYIVALDFEDIAVLQHAAESAKTAPRNATTDDLARITARGLGPVMGLIKENQS
ncbi:MAG: hypothetical protein QM658_13680 [Gordonia sp. (in: high G+C Gram-positive bacteria)]